MALYALRKDIRTIDYVAQKQPCHYHVAVKIPRIASCDIQPKYLLAGCSKYGCSSLLSLQGSKYTEIVTTCAVASYTAQSKSTSLVLHSWVISNSFTTDIVAP